MVDMQMSGTSGRRRRPAPVESRLPDPIPEDDRALVTMLGVAALLSAGMIGLLGLLGLGLWRLAAGG